MALIDLDFSLKVISEIFAKLVGKKGVVGRIGGDEFAGVIRIEEPEDEAAFLEETYQTFDEFNAECDKPYNIMVAVGTYVLRSSDGLNLSQALTLADEKLYEVKKLRKKDVAKIV